MTRLRLHTSDGGDIEPWRALARMEEIQLDQAASDHRVLVFEVDDAEIVEMVMANIQGAPVVLEILD